MSYFPINGLIAFFDLRNTLCDSSQDKHKCMYELTLHYDIKISFFNNFYYFIDFADCKLKCLRPDLNSAPNVNSIVINLQKEVINAINAIIYNEERKKFPNIHYSEGSKRRAITNDIDQFMIPNTVDKILMPFCFYINNGASFSSMAYKIACEAKLKEEPNPTNLELKDVKKAINNFNSILKIKNKDCTYNFHPFYILSKLWKSIYYINHDLRIDASIHLRSTFETLVRSKFESNERICSKEYEQYCGCEEINDFLKKYQESRNNSVHALIIPQERKESYKFAKHLIDFFYRDFKIDMSDIIK